MKLFEGQPFLSSVGGDCWLISQEVGLAVSLPGSSGFQLSKSVSKRAVKSIFDSSCLNEIEANEGSIYH